VVAIRFSGSTPKKIGSATLKERFPSDSKVLRIYRRHLEFNKQITAKVVTSIAN